MKFNPPKKITFYISVALAILGLLGAVGVTFLSGFAFWLLLAAYVVLAASLFIKGM